jgi:chemotaxis protein CheX
MQAEIHLETYRADISQLAESVFLTMLDLEVHPADSNSLPETEMITGAVYYAGPWRGAVLLQCDRAQACAFAARLMRAVQPIAFDDDARDAIGELTNILGGNLKPLLPHGVALSSPSVVEGYPSALRICDKSPIIRLGFHSELGMFWLTVTGIPD